MQLCGWLAFLYNSFCLLFLMPFLLPHAIAAFGEFVGEGYVGGIFQILVYEPALCVAALEHIELFLQFLPRHITWIDTRW